MYAESLTGAVDIRDEDDDQPGAVGDYMFTPMYTYVYEYRYRCPPAYSEVGASYVLLGTSLCWWLSCNLLFISVFEFDGWLSFQSLEVHVALWQNIERQLWVKDFLKVQAQ